MEPCAPELEESLFRAEQHGQIMAVTLKRDFLRGIMDLSDKDRLMAFLEELEDRADVRVVLLMGCPDRDGREEYSRLAEFLFDSADGATHLARMCNAMNQLILTVMDLGKIVVHADAGPILPPYQNIGLACFYRLAGDDAEYLNPDLEMGLVPKGGAAWFLTHMLGRARAARILLSGRTIPAAEALELGLVNEVVPAGELPARAMDRAKEIAARPVRAMVGLKRLLNCCLLDLKRCLECEDQLLQGIYQSHTVGPRRQRPA